MAEKLFVE